MKFTKRQNKILYNYFFHLGFIILLIFTIASSVNENHVVINNFNTVKALSSSVLNLIEREEVNFVIDSYQKVFSITEINNYKGKKVEFVGTLTGYGPDCVGCSGIVGCFPYQNVTNGNIYYEDSTYGKIRILAADKNIPCGSIIKISNYDFIEGDFYGIVLDRGSAINGLTMDLLYESESETVKIGRTYEINFKIERWGF